jgi:hypothetical protein
MDFSDSFNRSVNDAIGTALHNWLQSHWPLNWMVAYPLASLGVAALGIILCWGLFGAIGRGVERFWIALLQTPFRWTNLLFQQLWVRRGGLAPRGSSRDQQIALLMQRLTASQREQAELLAQLSALMQESSRD